MAALCDVNVLVALLHARHVHSARAVSWLSTQEETGSVLVCRVVQMGALRVLTNRSWLKEEVLSAEQFWTGWDKLLGDDRFAMLAEPELLEEAWRRVTVRIPKGQAVETDAYLAALALSTSHRVVTLDRGFRRFPDLQIEFLA
ncbi:MAG: PIN domain-containing protein [Nitrospirae bacterium]|nr:PIN domain-containing protein [Nitrospirota bacterium]